MPSPEQELAWEAERRPRAVFAGATAALLILGGGIFSGIASSRDYPSAGVLQAITPALQGKATAAVDPHVAAAQFYDEPAYPEATGYPENDYDDGYGHYPEDAYPTEHYAAAPPPRNGMGATRAVPLPPNTHDDYDDRYDDYDDEPPPPPQRARTSPVDDDDEKPGAWKRPAIIGGIVVAGLVALAVWLLSPNNPAPAAPGPSTSSKPTPTSDSLPLTSELPTTTVDLTSTPETTTSRRTTQKPTTSREAPPTTKTTESTSDTPTTSAKPPTTTPTTTTTAAGG